MSVLQFVKERGTVAPLLTGPPPTSAACRSAAIDSRLGLKSLLLGIQGIHLPPGVCFCFVTV